MKLKEKLKLPREDSFRSDPRLKSYQKSDCADYKEGIFDQGHMVPNASLQHSYQAMDNSFLMSNMTPQHCKFNRGIWQRLEGLQRKWAIAHGELYVISGTIYDRDGDKLRDPDQIAWRMKGERGTRVAIPSHQYKIFIIKENSQWQSLSIVLPNIDKNISDQNVVKYLNDNISTLAEIKSITGFDFINGNEVKESTNIWKYTGKLPKALVGRCFDKYSEY